MKFCGYCGAEMAESNAFCMKCGHRAGEIAAPLTSQPIAYKLPDQRASPSRGADKLLMAFAVITIVYFLIQLIVTKITPNWFLGGAPAMYIYQFASILWTAAFLLPAIAIKDVSLKVISIIIVIIPVVYWIISTIGVVLERLS
jgi:hypothetical protein